jgi:hypothetical protein
VANLLDKGTVELVDSTLIFKFGPDLEKVFTALTESPNMDLLKNATRGLPFRVKLESGETSFPL